MTQRGYAVRKVGDGGEASRAVEEDPPDLILLDVNPPGCIGHDVCEVIRANPHWQRVVIVMLTAKGRDVEREKGLALGAHDHVTKPYSAQEVVDKVHELLQRQVSWD